MGLGAIAGLTGLSKSVDHAAATQREFATMDGLQKDMQKEKEQNLLAQELEAKQYEEIAAKASEMLGPDRQKIRNKSLELQQNIRSKIEEYGSRKAFFENGGVALLSKYKSDLLSSDETLSYMDNKKNSESLVRLQESGKGGLIAQRDLQSLVDYNNGVGDGKITYSGLKAEVKIPHESFNFQEEVPAGNTLAANRLAIYNNWLLENPGKKEYTGQDLEDELILYTIQNHSGMGSNQLKYQHDLARQARKQEAEDIQKAGTAEDNKEEYSFVSQMNNGLTAGQENTPATLDNIMGDENYTIKVARANPGLTTIAGRITPYNDYSSNTSSADSNWITGTQFLDKWGKKISRATGFDTKYKLAGAAMVPVKKTKAILEFLYPGSISANSISVGLNESEFYSANGQLLKKEYVDENSETSMKYGGLIYAYVDGNGKMITKPLDSNGKPLEKTKGADGKWKLHDDEIDHRKAYSGNITHEMFSVLTDADGNKIYHKVGAQGLVQEAALSEAIGITDNITSKVKAKAKIVNRENEIALKTDYDRRVLQNEVAIASSEGGIFSTPEFRADVKLSEVAGNGNRATLQKAYYMAYSALHNKGSITAQTMADDGAYKRGHPANFSKAVGYAKELKDGLINTKGINDVNYVKLFAKITSAGNKEDEAENEVLAQTWIKIYELLNKK